MLDSRCFGRDDKARIYGDRMTAVSAVTAMSAVTAISDSGDPTSWLA
jgi:hypothetical protein